MKQEVSPKMLVIAVVILAVAILGIGYKLFFTRATIPPPTVKPGQDIKTLMHPKEPGAEQQMMMRQQQYYRGR